MRERRTRARLVASVAAALSLLASAACGPGGSAGPDDAGANDASGAETYIPDAIAEQPAGFPPVKVPAMYEYLSDTQPDRSTAERVSLLAETRTDLVFRGWFNWYPTPLRCNDFPDSTHRDICRNNRYSYEEFGHMVAEAKSSLPDLLICGSLPAQKLSNPEWDPVNAAEISFPETWNMALDPAKWGLDYPKEKFQCEIGNYYYTSMLDCTQYQTQYRPADAAVFFPDITNVEFQALFVRWAGAQIDAGADMLWIDLLWTQAWALGAYTGNLRHPAVKESVEAANAIITRIRGYGTDKGKRVYVGSWPPEWDPPETYRSEQDFATLPLRPGEVRNMTIDATDWEQRLDRARRSIGEVPMFAMFDWWGGDDSPLALFAWKSLEDQDRFLRIADAFFISRGLPFIYPVHGGDTGTWLFGRRAYGQWNWYDCAAPEFQTCETIKELALVRRPL